MRDTQADAVRAKQLLDDDLMRHMLAQAEAGVIDTMAALTIKQMGDHVTLITLVNQLQAVRALPQMLTDAVAAAKDAERTPPAVA